MNPLARSLDGSPLGALPLGGTKLGRRIALTEISRSPRTPPLFSPTGQVVHVLVELVEETSRPDINIPTRVDPRTDNLIATRVPIPEEVDDYVIRTEHL